MRELSPAGLKIIDELSLRHGFSREAVLSMLQSVMNGNGSIVHFDHPEFGGCGEWMPSGMIMLSDMFNHALKHRIDELCHELLRLVSSDSGCRNRAHFQPQTQSIGGRAGTRDGHSQSGGDDEHVGNASLFVSTPAGNPNWQWWPQNLGSPTSTGSQSGVRYAYFAQPRRLVLEVGGEQTVYDTLDHRITGFSQLEPTDQLLTFTSQYGLISVAALPVLDNREAWGTTRTRSSDDPLSMSPVLTTGTTAGSSHQHVATAERIFVDSNDSASDRPATSTSVNRVSSTSPVSSASSIPDISDTIERAEEIFMMIERLASLHEKKILTDEEFSSKKADLLDRL